MRSFLSIVKGQGKVIEDTTVDWRSDNILHHRQSILLNNCVSRIPHSLLLCIHSHLEKGSSNID